MLEEYADSGLLKKYIKKKFSLYPGIEEKEVWESVKEVLMPQAQRLAEESKEALDCPLKASEYMEYEKNGNRINYEKKYMRRRNALTAYTLLEIFTDNGDYLGNITDLLWMIMDEAAWCYPAHKNASDFSDALCDADRPLIDLVSGVTAQVLAFVYQTIGTRLNGISKNITKRIQNVITERITDEYLEHSDYWWMGFPEAKFKMQINNWNPWINGNVLIAVLCVEQDDEKKLRVVEKVLRSTEKYISCYPEDGACDEGPEYWSISVGSLIKMICHLYNFTDGAIDLRRLPKIQNAAEYIINAYICKDRVMNFADASSKVELDAAEMIYYGKVIENERLTAFGQYLYSRNGDKQYRQHFVDAVEHILVSNKFKFAEKQSPELPCAYYFESLQVAFARSYENPEKGLYFAAKGGTNSESHNHNDIGSFILYKNSVPFIVDAGKQTYKKETFSDLRYTLWENCSQYHNVPTIDGENQQFGEEYHSTSADFQQTEKNVVFSVDIKEAYGNKNDIKKWKRTFNFEKGEGEKVYFSDDFELEKESNCLIWNFITPCSVVKDDKGLRFVSENNVELRMDFENSADFELSAEDLQFDELMGASWQTGLKRIRLICKKTKIKGNLLFCIY